MPTYVFQKAIEEDHFPSENPVVASIDFDWYIEHVLLVLMEMSSDYGNSSSAGSSARANM